LEAHDHRQDPGENGRRIEHCIGENEHLYEIIGGRPVYCQKLINGPGRGNDRWRYSRPNLIRSHAQRLPGWRPSSAVHLFGGVEGGQKTCISLVRRLACVEASFTSAH
jgi:hypothetical protein